MVMRTTWPPSKFGWGGQKVSFLTTYFMSVCYLAGLIYCLQHSRGYDLWKKFQEISGEPIILRHIQQVKDYLVIEKWKNPSCLGYIGDYTTQLCGDCSKPLQGSLLNNQYNGSPETFTFFRCLIFPAAVVTSATSSWVVLSLIKGWYGSLWRSRVINHSNATGSILSIT